MDDFYLLMADILPGYLSSIAIVVKLTYYINHNNQKHFYSIFCTVKAKNCEGDFYVSFMADILPGHLYWPMTEVHLYNHGVIQSEQGELVQVLVG